MWCFIFSVTVHFVCKNLSFIWILLCFIVLVPWLWCQVQIIPVCHWLDRWLKIGYLECLFLVYYYRSSSQSYCHHFPPNRRYIYSISFFVELQCEIYSTPADVEQQTWEACLLSWQLILHPKCGSQAAFIMSIDVIISDLILNWPQRYEDIELLKGSQIHLFINGQLFPYIFVIILSFYSCVEHKAFMKFFCWVLRSVLFEF
jgi:hypothetical protein